MKYTQLLFLSLILIIASCKNETKTDALKEVTKQYAFTDSVKLDSFKVVLDGEKSEEIKMVFTITNYSGQEIYKKEIEAKEILSNFLASEDLKKESDKIKFLNEHLQDFFDDEHFLEPAVTTEQQPDNNAPDKTFYDELKQTQLNGFYYTLAKDKSFYIAWSVKEQRVKVYYQCC